MKYPLEEQYSIIQKLDGQMLALQNMGYDVYYISFDRKKIYLNHNNSREVIQKTTFGGSKLYYHFLSFYDIYHAARIALKRIDFDVIYFRYGPLNYSGMKLFQKAYQKSVLVVEIPTFPANSERQKTAIRRVYMKYSDGLWKKASRYIKLFTIIGEHAESWLGVPTLNIDNGVSVDSLPLKVGTKTDDKKHHLLAVAAMCKWQAYDRVIQGLAEWNSTKKDTSKESLYQSPFHSLAPTSSWLAAS